MDTISKGSRRKLKLFSSIRTKFALLYFSVIAVLLVIMNTYFLTASREMIFNSKKTFITVQSNQIATNISASFDNLTVEGVNSIMERLDVREGLTRITILDNDGTIIYDSTKGSDDTYPEFMLEYIETAMNGYDVFYSKLNDGVFSSSAFTPVMDDNADVIGVVYVHENDSEQGAILIGLQSTIKSISIAISVFSVAMVYFIIRTLMHRITLILNAINSVREGEYNYRILINGNDELALISDEFNSLTNRLRETEEIRRRFVADASHELKTPLASIRLLSDSILHNEDMDVDTVNEFVSDIGAEAERLSRTTEKLMNLTRLDNNIKMQKEKVDIRTVISSTLRMLRPLAEKSDIEFETALDGGCFVLSTEDDIHQVVFNLIENAIKYNLPNGKVDISLKREEDISILTVDDTGIGVPESDLPYIFDRFYRVDKARSREAGGSGLGLSIVKMTVRDSDGTIKAERRETGGMRFEVRFPLFIPPETETKS